MRSRPLQDAYEKAETIYKEMSAKAKKRTSNGLLDTHLNDNNAVHVLHEEGTSLFFRSAFAFEFEIEDKLLHRTWQYYAIVPEHHDMIVYSADEVDIFWYRSAAHFPRIDNA